MSQKFIEEADFRQERDFGAKVGATFEFAAAHWRPLGKCLAYFVVPAALLMGLAMGISQNQAFGSGEVEKATTSLGRIRSLNNVTGLYHWLGVLASFISYTLLGATVYGYVRVRLALPATEEVTPRLVGEQISRYAPRLLLSAFLGFILVIIGYVLLVVPGVYLSFALSLAWTVQVLEDTTLSQSFRRSIYLIKNHWWSTLGLIIVMSIIVALINTVFQLPYLLTFFGRLLQWDFLTSDVLTVASTMLASVGQMVLYSLIFLALLFQYFNLVEQKEGLGLRNLVASLGSGAAPVAYNQAYRPDDEGEY
jgi:hypothetical protein